MILLNDNNGKVTTFFSSSFLAAISLWYWRRTSEIIKNFTAPLRRAQCTTVLYSTVNWQCKSNEHCKVYSNVHCKVYSNVHCKVYSTVYCKVYSIVHCKVYSTVLHNSAQHSSVILGAGKCQNIQEEPGWLDIDWGSNGNLHREQTGFVVVI